MGATKHKNYMIFISIMLSILFFSLSKIMHISNIITQC